VNLAKSFYKWFIFEMNRYPFLTEVVQYSKVSEARVEELRKIAGDRNVYTEAHQRAMRAATPCPFPIYRWKDYLPDVVVLPGSTEEVAEIVKLANEHRIPIVPRAGGSGLNDGAVPLRHGIVIDIKRMNQILEVDEDNMCVTTQTGINNQERSRSLKPYDLWWPFDPASFPVSIVGGNIGTGAWSLIGGVSGHIPDLVLSMTFVLPTGKVVEIGESGGRKIRKSSTGYRLKDLFIGHQGTLGIATEVTLEAFPRPEAQFSAFFGYENFEAGYSTLRNVGRSFLRTMAASCLFDEHKVEFLRRDDDAFIPLSEKIRSVVVTAFYGSEEEVQGASKKIMRVGQAGSGKYLGEGLSEADWAFRHDRYHLALHGRNLKGEVMPSTWHCEDAAINYSELPEVGRKWHSIVKELNDKHGIFDDCGIFFYSNNPYKPWGDYLSEIDIFVSELDFNDTTWKAYVELKRRISEVTLEHHGSMTACHGATRPGDNELIPIEFGNGMYDIMKTLKKTFDPNNIMNPGKYGLDSAYGDEPASSETTRK